VRRKEKKKKLCVECGVCGNDRMSWLLDGVQVKPVLAVSNALLSHLRQLTLLRLPVQVTVPIPVLHYPPLRSLIPPYLSVDNGLDPIAPA